MKNVISILFALLFLTFYNITFAETFEKQDLSVSSPDGKIVVTFQIRDGIPYYSVRRNNSAVVNNSRLGFTLKDIPSLDKDFKISASKQTSFDETWTQPWGEKKDIRNNYNSLRLSLQEKTALKRKMDVIFKVYNDGVGFRYEIPQQENLKEFQIMDELTEFAMAYNFDAWWTPAFGNNQDSEYFFQNNKLNDLKEDILTPLTLEYNDSLFVSIHEAALVDYAGMSLKPKGNQTFSSSLVAWANGIKVQATAPMKTPWRSIQIAAKAGDLITSYLILNLNEPNKLADISYIKPGKYDGMWWGMHLKKYTWDEGATHGANTENVKQLIDFACQNNISGVLVEGWNKGWQGDWSAGTFNFSKPADDFDMQALTAYAAEKGVGIIAHHETGGNIPNYEKQLDEAFDYIEKSGIHALKTGYVAKMISGNERHQGQFMVRHYHRVMETAANHKVMLDVHEPVKDTGLRRTYPNMMTREGARGTEYEAWSEGNPPSHTTILPFTRCLGGPLDYTPGIFDIMIKDLPDFRVHTTLAKQLALYVVIYSPLQMVADLPENYKGNPAFKFIVDVPTDWEDTKVLNAKIGNYITVVRKDRKSSNWFLGSITNEDGRTLQTKLDFLPAGKKFNAEIYADGQDANMLNNPQPVNINSQTVDSESILSIILAPGGGQAIRFSPVD